MGEKFYVLDCELCVANWTSADGFSNAIGETGAIIDGADESTNEVIRDMCEWSVVKWFEYFFFKQCGAIRQCTFCCGFSRCEGFDNGGGRSKEISDRRVRSSTRGDWSYGQITDHR